MHYTQDCVKVTKALKQHLVLGLLVTWKDRASYGHSVLDQPYRYFGRPGLLLLPTYAVKELLCVVECSVQLVYFIWECQPCLASPYKHVSHVYCDEAISLWCLSAHLSCIAGRH